MNAETCYKFARAYKLYYQGTYDFKKYGGNVRVRPLIEQPDRRFYWRIAQKLNAAEIHALFTVGHFFKPNAYIAELASPESFTRAVAFASRAQNGQPLLEADLYELRKYLQTVDLDAWLYGEDLGGRRSAIPECLQMVISGALALDVACLLLLIPQPQLQYHWLDAHPATPVSTAFGSLGSAAWIDRLKKLDQLLRLQRPGWRMMTQEVAKNFWTSLGVETLARQQLQSVEEALF